MELLVNTLLHITPVFADCDLLGPSAYTTSSANAPATDDPEFDWSSWLIGLDGSGEFN